MIVDSEGNELEKVECPKKCKNAIPPYSEEKVERKAPGQVHSSCFPCSVCNGFGWIWRRKG